MIYYIHLELIYYFLYNNVDCLIQLKVYQNIIQDKLSVRATELMVKSKNPTTSKKNTETEIKLSVYYQHIEMSIFLKKS